MVGGGGQVRLLPRVSTITPREDVKAALPTGGVVGGGGWVRGGWVGGGER